MSTREITAEEIRTIVRATLRMNGMSFDSMEPATQKALCGDVAAMLRAMVSLGYGVLHPEELDAREAAVLIARA